MNKDVILIDKNALLNVLKEEETGSMFAAHVLQAIGAHMAESITFASFSVVKKAINNAPSIDPVKHGHWIDNGPDKPPTCSRCGGGALLNYESDYHKSDACPHCGAKMDERKESV